MTHKNTNFWYSREFLGFSIVLYLCKYLLMTLFTWGGPESFWDSVGGEKTSNSQIIV